ncbi:MAG: xanthine dehydrogenase family protein molybdopterin-binding subunit [Clostridiales bacterium]|nr:xanthine dehydrogenase family protein molybdopterin-binding subunit [Clostridiales bacterium]
MSATYSWKSEDARKEEEAYRYVGKSVPYKDARSKATGAAKYSVDIQRPGAYLGKVLECPHTHARVRSIDVSEARKLPGVAAVITADDVPDVKYNPAGLEYAARNAKAAAEDSVNDMTAVPRKSHYKGEAVALVAARDEETALKALELIKVDYEVLPFTLDTASAMREGAPLVHEEAGSNLSMIFDSFPGNRGDADAAFAQADFTVEGDLLSSRQHTMALEPLSCTAEFDSEGNLTVWVAHQRPFILRRMVAGLAGLPEAKVNVVCEHAGGFFGEANYVIVPFAVFLAKEANKPVRIEFSREELTRHVPCREIYQMHGKLGFTAEGRLIAATEDMVVDSGAYFNRSCNTLTPAMGSFSGQYALPVFRGVGKIVYTNTPGTSGIRGYGPPAGMALLSHLMDLGAEKLGMDRVEFRIQNYRFNSANASLEKKGPDEHEGSTPATMGLGLETQESVMRVAAKQFGWAEKSRRPRADGKWRYGIGVCDYTDVSGPQPHEMNDRQCVMTLEEDGSVTVSVNYADGGQNLLGAGAQIAAEASGLHYEDFRFLHAQTTGTLYDIGLGGNSGNFGMGNLLAVAGKMLKEEILKKAASFMDAESDGLDIKDGVIFSKADPQNTMPVKKLAYDSIVVQQGASEHISVTARYSAFYSPMAVGVVMADVRIDTETGDIFVDKLQICHDCGIAINPMGVAGQLQGGGVMGYGYALFEDLSLGEDGSVRGGNYNTYKLASALDIPDFDVIVYENPCPYGPYGAKGVGQSGTVGISGAIAGAIYDATGVWMETMPFTPEKLLAAMRTRTMKE